MENIVTFTQERVTECVEHKFNYSWKLNKCDVLNRTMDSSYFTLGTGSNSSKIRFCVCRYSIAIEFDNIEQKDHQSLQTKTSIANNEGTIIIKDRHELVKRFDGCSYMRIHHILDSSDCSLLKETAYNYTILCEITYYTVIDYSLHSLTRISDDLSSVVLNAFEQRFKTEEFCDFTIIAPCKRQLQTHKFVLAAHSPVFAALFKTDMEEKRKNCMEIQDISYEALSEMLRFMYSAKVNNLEKLGAEILLAAEKYQIDGLKKLCLEYLSNNINIDNAAKILNSSYIFEYCDMRNEAIKFIKANAMNVVKTEEFKSLINGCLASEIICALIVE